MAWITAAGTDVGKRFIRVADYYSQDELRETEFAREFLVPNGFVVESPIVHIISPEEGLGWILSG